MAADVTELIKQVSAEMLGRLARAARASLPSISADFKAAVKGAVLRHPVVAAMRTDRRLIRQLGLPGGSATFTEAVAEAVAAAATASVEATEKEVRLRLTAFRTDFGDALASPKSVFRTRKGGVVPWLQMVLFGDYAALTASFGVWVKPGGRPMAASHSGDAIMRPLGGRIKRGFALEPVAAGTAAANWLTDAAAAVNEKLVATLEAAFRRISVGITK